MRSAFGSVMFFLVAGATLALAHETGTIRLAAKEVRVGGELMIHGEKLPKSATLRLQLRGSLETFPLGEVRTDTAGKFDARLALPTEARAGAYTVLVLASDGDISARTDLTITPPPPAEMSPTEHARMDSATAMPDMPHARADMMDVSTAMTTGEWIAIVSIVLASVAGGLALLFAARRMGA